jgi:hypothetical protein
MPYVIKLHSSAAAEEGERSLKYFTTHRQPILGFVRKYYNKMDWPADILETVLECIRDDNAYDMSFTQIYVVEKDGTFAVRPINFYKDDAYAYDTWWSVIIERATFME